MSKEKMSAWRSMLNKDAEDARVMREMHANQTAMNNAAPRVTAVPEDAMHTLWQSERKINLNGKWYVPISEVADILTTPTEEPLSEEWQAKTFPNLNIGSGMGEPIDCSAPTRFKKDDKKWFAKADRKQRGY